MLMVPNPSAIGLTLCDYVIIEERSRKASTIGSFSALKCTSFPALAKPFCVFATLTDGEGDASVELTVTELTKDEVLGKYRGQTHFSDRLAEVRILFRLKEWIFPSPGVYLFTLTLDHEWIAHKRLPVYLGEE
jgi:hypothetical protein